MPACWDALVQGSGRCAASLGWPRSSSQVRDSAGRRLHARAGHSQERFCAGEERLVVLSLIHI
eukprot:7363014-Pyramimonas_sp.AAC.1